MIKSFALTLVALLLLVYTPYAATTTPTQCLNAISAAIDEANIEAFENLVDIDGIIAQGTDQFLSEIQKPEIISQLNPMFALMLSGLGSQNANGPRKLIVQGLHSFISNGISSGAFAGKQLSNQQTEGLLAPLFANASIGRKEIRNIGETMQSDNGWIVPFSIHDYGNDNDYPVIGQFTPGENGLRLTGIKNLDQIFQQILMEANQ